MRISDWSSDVCSSDLKDIGDFLTAKGTTEAERNQTINSQILSLPGSFETSSDLLAAMMRNRMLGRPDDYYETLPGVYRAMTAADMAKAAREAIERKSVGWGQSASARVEYGGRL